MSQDINSQESNDTTTLISEILKHDRYTVLGRLIGEIVHSLNNYNGAVLGYGDLLLLNPDTGPFQTELQSIIDSATLSSELLRTFSRLKMSILEEMKVADATLVLDAILDMFSILHKNRKLEIERDFPGVLHMSGNTVRFTQAIFHAVLITVRTALGNSVDKRQIKASLRHEDSWIILTLSISEGQIPGEIEGVDQSWIIEDTSYDLRVLNELCESDAEWGVDSNGKVLTLKWLLAPA